METLLNVNELGWNSSLFYSTKRGGNWYGLEMYFYRESGTNARKKKPRGEVLRTPGILRVHLRGSEYLTPGLDKHVIAP
jgi:hypothetical protein